MNVNRLQKNVLRSCVSFPTSFEVVGLSKNRSFVSACPIDRFFEQEQNKTAYGWQDESPIAASSPSAEKHITLVNAERQSSKLSVKDLMDTTVSRHIQTLSEVSTLAKSLHKPLPSEFEEDEHVTSDSDSTVSSE